ncbi:YaiI/YqxD family protein [Bacillus sp. FJAT-50079]|uniref:YaiI/YqxD family protein n=1 Tax=Bacillus sp. FJAT-50079 TaxID=2833577 RepID=UPI0032D5A5C2
MEGCRISNGNQAKAIIYVDADACPVKAEISAIANEYNWDIRFVASYDHKPKNEESNPQWCFVDAGKDSVDLYIVNKIRRGDVLITQDIGLASLVLPKGVYAISPRGTEYKEDTIEMALDFRFLAAKAREAGHYGKGPSPFGKEDRRQFQASLRRLLSKNEGV